MRSGIQDPHWDVWFQFGDEDMTKIGEHVRIPDTPAKLPTEVQQRDTVTRTLVQPLISSIQSFEISGYDMEKVMQNKERNASSTISSKLEESLNDAV